MYEYYIFNDFRFLLKFRLWLECKTKNVEFFSLVQKNNNNNNKLIVIKCNQIINIENKTTYFIEGICCSLLLNPLEILHKTQTTPKNSTKYYLIKKFSTQFETRWKKIIRNSFTHTSW